MFSSNTSQVSGGYEIQRSLRFNSADSAYLNRTPASAGNRKTWTLSAWVKRSALPVDENSIIGMFDGSSNQFRAFFTDTNTLRIFSFTGSFQLQLVTTQVFRDVSAWGHLVISIDTTQATAANRASVYWNGVQITSFTTATYPSQNADLIWNQGSQPHEIGSVNDPGGRTDYFNGYMTEVNFIDGQALTPSSFGAFDAQTGVWGPTPYAGSYGTNGFYLNFSDNSNTTAATLGKDYSGNGNNWTPNNFSVSAGAGNDSLVDVPTNWGTDTGVGGTVRGNYCTLNPLYFNSTGISNGNLDVVLSGGTRYGTMSFTTGKWYWEVTPTASLSSAYLGVMDSTFIGTDGSWGTGTTATYVSNGDKYGMGGAGAYGASYTNNDVIGFALDLDAGTMVFYKNGVSQGTAFTGMTGREWRPMVYAGAGTYACNFGQRPFAYTAPSGFKALNTQNLPTPTIGATTATQAGKYYNAVLWTGNGSVPRAITGLGFQPDFVWGKARSIGFSHVLYDSVRGTGTTKSLISNSTDAEGTASSFANISSFDSDGFTIGTTGSTNILNDNGYTFVGWGWRASNAAAVTNTAGSITSTVSANTTSGFSVVTFTGNSVAGATIGHGLGVAPAMVITKNRVGTDGWQVYHRSLPSAAYRIQLQSAVAADIENTVWNSTAPTATVFSVGTNVGNANQVAYCFAEVPGYSRFGSYTGNNSADGPFVFCGFRPAFVMIKSASQSGVNWVIFDTKRSTTNVASGPLFPNTSGAEGNSTPQLDILSNGFKWRNTDANSFPGNVNGDTYIFAAFAEAPQKFALAR